MKDLPGYEGLYGVTDDGRVFAHPKTWISGHNRKCSHDGMWLTLKPDKDGYHKVMLSSGGKLKNIGVHRLVAFTYLTPSPGRNVVNHKDGNKQNNHVTNLEWCTDLENKEHAKLNGLTRNLQGMEHSLAKLTDEEVYEIRRLCRLGVLTHSEIGAQFGVVRQTIGKIASRQLWSHLPETDKAAA